MSDLMLFQQACREGRIEAVKRYIVDPSANENLAIRVASCNGHFEVVQFLLNDKRVDPTSDDNYPIRSSSEFGHIEVVKLLLPRTDPSANNNHAIRQASRNGHFEVVKLLLPITNPGAEQNYAIRIASKRGHIEIVKLLLKDKRVDPSDVDNSALKLAFEKNHLGIVRVLLDDDRVKKRGIPKDISIELEKQIDQTLVIYSTQFQNQTNLPTELLHAIEELISFNPDVKIPISNKTVFDRKKIKKINIGKE